MSRVARLICVCALAAASLALAGCGQSNGSGYRQQAQTEGLLVDAGNLVYQIQLSRYLNPADQEDREYLTGLPQGLGGPQKGEVYFGIFMRVQNYTKQPQTPASQFTITDTQRNVYQPIPQDPKQNPFVYTTNPIAPGAIVPAPDTAMYQGPIQGALILFKLKTSSVQNRPLVFRINPGGGRAEAQVDVDL